MLAALSHLDKRLEQIEEQLTKKAADQKAATRCPVQEHMLAVLSQLTSRLEALGERQSAEDQAIRDWTTARSTGSWGT